MIINDLDFLGIVEEKNQIFGGMFAKAQAIATTSPYSSFAIASGVAFGDLSSTNVQTSTINYKTNLFSGGFAFADASAAAITNNTVHLASSTSISYFFRFNL
ncbi:hypothetical protein [Mastigocoleus testarum]|uniref:Uncharacterized protein n=1 Tax=Mastigocoleus testarum BC008 TaxID=371196 RepID=A0A0V8A129_9CYAN|nr:hypothetical protein [Mastigocoleus testarum]KST70335.1 hypothetical protein BC008_44870 [Mastigocoleus testarum BC008]